MRQARRFFFWICNPFLYTISRTVQKVGQSTEKAQDTRKSGMYGRADHWDRGCSTQDGELRGQLQTECWKTGRGQWA